MWWLAIPVIGIVGKAVFDAITEEDSLPPSRKTTLQANLERLKGDLRFETAKKIAIMGQPGAGKSSLLKKMTNGEVVPPPVIGTHTDATNWSSDASCNLISRYRGAVFVDVPGYDTQTHPAIDFKLNFPFYDFDAFLFVVHGKLHAADEEIFRLANCTGKPICIARSFLDSLDEDEIREVERDLRQRLSVGNPVEFVFFSNRSGEGIKNIFQIICTNY